MHLQDAWPASLFGSFPSLLIKRDVFGMSGNNFHGIPMRAQKEHRVQNGGESPQNCKKTRVLATEAPSQLNQQKCSLPPSTQMRGGGWNSLHTRRLFHFDFYLLCFVLTLLIWVVSVGKKVLQFFKVPSSKLDHPSHVSQLGVISRFFSWSFFSRYHFLNLR